MNKLNILALTVGLSAVIVLTFFLLTNWGKPIWFTEPNLLIRYTEVFLGFVSIPILIKLLIKEAQS